MADQIHISQPTGKREYTQEDQIRLAIKVQKVWRGFAERMKNAWIRDLLKTSKNIKGAKKTAADEISKGIKSIMKSGTAGITGEAKEEKAQKRVRFQEELKKSRSPVAPGKGKKQVVPEDARKELEKKMKKALTGLDALLKKDEEKGLVKLEKQEEISPGKQYARIEKDRFMQCFLNDMISNAVLYGESVLMSREIQQKYEERSVRKVIYPHGIEFQYSVVGPIPRSVNCINSLGRIIYAEELGQVQQIDIVGQKPLSAYFIGTRMPLQYSEIIDMICDPKSCRIYSLNGLWKLEVWSLEQKSTLPIKRIPVVNCEISRDYIETSYKARFQKSKPTFLSLHESASQILVVNTSCVDGNLVFVDPISLSISKRIHLCFTDYEIPSHIAEAIEKLKTLLVCPGEEGNLEANMAALFKKLKSGDKKEVSYDDFVSKIKEINAGLETGLLYEICRQIDADNNLCISLEELAPYFDSKLSEDNTGKVTSEINWPEWVLREKKLLPVKEILLRICDAIEKRNIPVMKAFGIFDTENDGRVEKEDFGKVLCQLCPGLNSEDTVLMTRLAELPPERTIIYEKFCQMLNKKMLQSEIIGEEAEKILREPLTHKNDLPTLIRKCFENGIILKSIFKKEDRFQQGLIFKDRFYQILESLPLGYTFEDLYQIFKDSSIFDAHGNADYTMILHHEIYAILDKIYSQRRTTTEQSMADSQVHGNSRNFTFTQKSDSIDSRKVIVEDVIYIDDFDLIIYTCCFPKSSNIYISHTKSLSPPQIIGQTDSFGSPRKIKPENKIEAAAQPIPDDETQQDLLKYKFLATLKGHKNSYPPTIYYVEETGCLLSGEKNDKESISSGGISSNTEHKRMYDPTVHPSAKLDQGRESDQYANYNNRLLKNGLYEIIIWNLQKDLIHLMQANPPWTIRPSRKFEGPKGSILDLCYLPLSQLIVAASSDQTITFYDPVSEPYLLTQPNNIPSIPYKKPGYYTGPNEETTQSNKTYRMVKRIYVKPPYVCYKILPMILNTVPQNATSNKAGSDKGQQASISQTSSIEWCVALQMTPSQGFAMKSQGMILGYGIEIVGLDIPAVRHDDPVPTSIIKECEDEVSEMRKKTMIAFQNSLPYNLERLMANSALEDSQMKNLIKLFKEAMLSRTNGKYMSSNPLKEAFRILLDIPARKKFGHLISKKSRGGALSVSEVYFYLKKYFQIHPTNLNQVLFAKLVNEFTQDKSKSLIEGIRKFPTEALNIYADYIRRYGISKDTILMYADKGKEYLSKSQFLEYLKSLNLALNDPQMDTIFNYLQSDKVTLAQLSSIFAEELKHYHITMFRRPNPIIEEIRKLIIPNKKLRLQESLAKMDTFGDGYITKKQFFDAFERAEVKMDKATLSYFFDMISEKFVPRETEKVISIGSFIKRVLTDTEAGDFQEIAQIFTKISSSLAYRGIDIEAVFADAALNDLSKPGAKILEVLSKADFEKRLDSLNITDLTKTEIKKLANFLAINETHEKLQAVYLKNFLHHTRSLPGSISAKSEPFKHDHLMAVISAKLLINESRFRRQCFEISELTENYLEVSDIKSVLLANGIISRHADIFVERMTSCSRINIDDLIAKMRAEASMYYNEKFNKRSEADKFGINFHQVLKELFVDNFRNIPGEALINKCMSFDKLNNGRIKLYHLLNILKHNIINIDEFVLAGLQCELSMIHPDEYIDYKEFFEPFIMSTQEESKTSNEVSSPTSPAHESKKMRTKLLYDQVIVKLFDKVKSNRINLKKAFSMFDNDSDNKITIDELEKTIEWIEVKLPADELAALWTLSYKDPEDQRYLIVEELIKCIDYSKQINVAYNQQQWNAAGKGISLMDQCKVILENADQLTFLLRKEYPESKSLIPSGVFMNCLRDANLGLSEDEIAMVARYAIRGSKRITAEQLENILSMVEVDLERDIINYPFFIQSIKSGLAREGSKLESAVLSLSSARDQLHSAPETARKLLQKKETELISKIKGYFSKSGLSFYDYFYSEECGFRRDEAALMTRKQILEGARVLKIPLSLQEQRLLQQLEDSNNENKISVRIFCDRFDTPESRERRMKQILEKMAIAIILKDIPWDLAYETFDKDNKGHITKGDFQQLFNYFRLNLSSFEIETMLSLIAEEISGCSVVTRVRFKEAIIDALASIKDMALNKLQEGLLITLHERLTLTSTEGASGSPSNASMGLAERFAKFDVNNTGMLSTAIFIKALEQLQIVNLSPREQIILLRAGNVPVDMTEDQKRVLQLEFNYRDFAEAIQASIELVINKRSDTSSVLIEKIYIMTQAKHMTVFETYCYLDSLLRGNISRLEFFAGLQSLGVDASQEQVGSLWAEIMLMNSGIGHREDKLTFYDLLSMFSSRGYLRLTAVESHIEVLTGEFVQQIRSKNINVETLFGMMDVKREGRVKKKSFTEMCKKSNISLSFEELNMIFDQIVLPSAVSSSGVSLQATITYKQLSDFIQQGSQDHDKITQLFVKVEKIGKRRNIDWRKQFKMYKEEKAAASKKKEVKNKNEPTGLTCKELANCIRQLRFGMKFDEIDLFANNFIFNKKGILTVDEFEKQLLKLSQEYEVKRADKIKQIKTFVDAFSMALKKQNATLENIFSELDRNQNGAISFSEFNDMILKLDLDIPKKDIANIFILLADNIETGKLLLNTMKKYIYGFETIDSSAGASKFESEDFLEESASAKLNDEREMLYQKLRSQLEEKKTNVYNIYLKLKIDTKCHITEKGIRQVFETIDLILSSREIGILHNEIKAGFGKEQYTYQDFMDFLIRCKIDLSELQKTVCDPGIVLCIQGIIKGLKKCNVNFEKAFELFSRKRKAYIEKLDFIHCIEGMQIGISKDDIVAMFSFMDKLKSNTIKLQDFLQAMSYGQQTAAPMWESEDSKSSSSKFRSTMDPKLQAGRVLKQLGEVFEKGGYSLKQIGRLLDINGTGIISKTDLTKILRTQEIEIGLSDVRNLISYFETIGNGTLYISDIMKGMQEVLNQGTSGLCSLMQAKPIIKRIKMEISGDFSNFVDEILKYDKLMEISEKLQSDAVALAELVGNSGIEKRNFYKILTRFGVELSEDEKGILNYAFEFKAMPSYLDTKKVLNLFESLPEVDRSKLGTRALGNYLKSHGLTIIECFKEEAKEREAITVSQMENCLKRILGEYKEKEIASLMSLVKSSEKREEGKGEEAKGEALVSVKEFAKKFYDAYLLDVAAMQLENMTKEDEFNLILNVIQKIKQKENITCERAFAELDRRKVGMLTITDLQIILPKYFDITLSREQHLILFKYMDTNEDGLVTQGEFTYFYNNLEKELQKAKEKQNSSLKKKSQVTLAEIFDSLLLVLKERNLTLFEIFEQLDVKRNGYILLKDFNDLLETIGYIISESQLNSLFKESDANFEGKVSYKMLHKYFRQAAEKQGIKEYGVAGSEEIFQWADKAMESVIITLNTIKKNAKSYFLEYDENRDNFLTPKEFREACKGLRAFDIHITRNQIDRLLLLFAVNRSQQTVISIDKINDYFNQYNSSPFFTSSKESDEGTLVDEDMFVMIVQHFDAFSYLIDRSYEISEGTQYMATHKSIFSTRGCSILADHTLVKRMLHSAQQLSTSMNDIFVMLSGYALEKIKSSAFCSLIDSKIITPPVQTQFADILIQYKIPEIDPIQVTIFAETKTELPSGCVFYKGRLESDQSPIKIYVYTTTCLNRVSKDGKVYWKHLEIELTAQMYMYQKNNDWTFKILGKYEKKTGIGDYSVEQYIIISAKEESDYLSMQEYLKVNGGLLRMPLLRGTETALYIAKMWAEKILQLLQALHSVGFVMRTLNPSHIYINKRTSDIKFGHFRGIGTIDGSIEGKINVAPDLAVHHALESGQSQPSLYSLHSSPFLAPEHLLKPFSDHTAAIDVYSFGGLLFSMLFGFEPISYIHSLSDWAKRHHISTLPLEHMVEPTSMSYTFDPFSSIDIHPIKQEIVNHKIIDKPWENTMAALKPRSFSSLMEGKSWLKPFRMLEAGKEGFEGKIDTKTIIKKVIQANEGNIESKTNLGLIFDIICFCMDLNPKNRPSILSLLHSPIFNLDKYERASAQKFAYSIALYKSPELCVTEQFTKVLRRMCLATMRNKVKENSCNEQLLSMEKDLVSVINEVTKCIQTISTPYITKIKSVMVDQIEAASPHAPLAKRIIEDKVIDMLIFLCHRYTRAWIQSKEVLITNEVEGAALKKVEEMANSANKSTRGILKNSGISTSPSKFRSKSIGKENQAAQMAEGAKTTIKRVRFEDETGLSGSPKKQQAMDDQDKLLFDTIREKQRSLALKFKTENAVLSSMCRLLHFLVLEMQYKTSVMAPHVSAVLNYLVKMLIGEEFILASDLALMQNPKSTECLASTTFFRNPSEFLNQDFAFDDCDRMWKKINQNKPLILFDTYFNYTTYSVVIPLYQDAVGIGGLGGGDYPVIHEHIQACNSTAEVYSMFGKKANKMYGEFMVSSKKTSEYYADLIRMCQNVSMLTEYHYGKAAKRSALGDICALLYGGNVDRIKAALDLRVTKYLHSYIQHKDNEIRTSCSLIFYQISRALANDDALSLLKEVEPLTVSSSSGTSDSASKSTKIKLKDQQQIESKTMTKKKGVPEALGEGSSATFATKKGKGVGAAITAKTLAASNKKTLPEMNKDLTLISYIYSNKAIIDPIDTRRYITFAYDLPTVHFEQNRIYLKCMGQALENPVYIAFMIRQIRANETEENKIVILRMILNLLTSTSNIHQALNSTVADLYFTLARSLTSLISKDKKQGVLKPLGSEIYKLFTRMFELRNPAIIETLKSHHGVRNLLKDCGLVIPKVNELGDILKCSEKILASKPISIAEVTSSHDISSFCRDLKAFLMHSRNTLNDEIIRKSYSTCVEVLARVADLAFTPKATAGDIKLLKEIFELWDWLAGENLGLIFLRVKEGNLIDWMLNKLTEILSFYRKFEDTNEKGFDREELSDTLYNKKKIIKAETAHKYEKSPFLSLSVPLQHIFVILLQKNLPEINAKLESLNFGHLFGEHLMLQFGYLKLAIDSEAERLGLLEVYVEQNHNRLASLEHLLKSSSSKLKSQFLKSRFLEKMASEYIKDTREFTVKYSKIDLKFLAFRHSFPLRNESISMMSEILKNKNNAYELYIELIQQMHNHQVMRNECRIITNFENVKELELQTSLLFFSVLLGYDETEAGRWMKDEGINNVMNELLSKKSIYKNQYRLLCKYFKIIQQQQVKLHFNDEDVDMRFN